MIRYAFLKLGMTSIFSAEGEEHGVTVLKLQPGKIVRHEKLKDGRTVVVVAYNTGKRRTTERGWAVVDASSYAVGSELVAPALTGGQSVKVTGTSKGRGFQDCITRHNFSGGPAAHGSRFHRAPGSIGMRTEPGRTPVGRKLPGQHGNVQVTLTNSVVEYWSSDEQLLAVRGGVPGCRGGLVFV